MKKSKMKMEFLGPIANLKLIKLDNGPETSSTKYYFLQ
jgi:hypothetical protein